MAQGLFYYSALWLQISDRLLVCVGVSGKNVTPNTLQSNEELPATTGSRNPKR